MKNFADRLLDAVDKKKNPSIIGLDSDFSRIPGILKKESEGRSSDNFQAAGNCMLEFNRRIVDSIHDIVPAVKIQSAFYEQYGPAGMSAFLETAKYARSKGLLVIGDVKRGDIGNTSRAYSNAYLGKVQFFNSLKSGYDLDAITVNPYLGSDGVMPFLEDCRNYGKGIFVLVKTSNPSSAELQDLACGDKKFYECVANEVKNWGEKLTGERGYSAVGAVVGANYPDQAASLRKIMPGAIFLVPGYGAQGGLASDIVPNFKSDGYGALIHSARDVIFAYEKHGAQNDFAKAARQAALKMRDDVLSSLKNVGISPWK